MHTLLNNLLKKIFSGIKAIKSFLRLLTIFLAFYNNTLMFIFANELQVFQAGGYLPLH